LDQGIHLASLVHDAALDGEAWPGALSAIAEACGAVGAAYLVYDKRAERIDRISLAGASVGLESAYIAHFAPLDPFRPILSAAKTDGEWVWLSECLPDVVGRGDPWYDDFLGRARIGNVLGTRVLDSPTHVAVVGIHRETGHAPRIDLDAAALHALTGTLCRAAALEQDLRALGQERSIGLLALDGIPAGVIVIDGDGRVRWLNRAAEDLLQQDDGLMSRDGRLQAARPAESAKLARLIAGAVGGAKSPASAGGMLVARRRGRPWLSLSVTPLGPRTSGLDEPLALILVSDPAARVLSEAALAELFGLSPAERRLAAALMSGQTLTQCAVGFGVEISTVRTQLRAILEKVGVSRQTDLLRVLAGVQIASRTATPA